VKKCQKTAGRRGGGNFFDSHCRCSRTVLQDVPKIETALLLSCAVTTEHENIAIFIYILLTIRI